MVAATTVARPPKEETYAYPKVGFIVYGVHKDGLQDPMGQPFIDDALIAAGQSGPARGASNWSSTT